MDMIKGISDFLRQAGPGAEVTVVTTYRFGSTEIETEAVGAPLSAPEERAGSGSEEDTPLKLREWGQRLSVSVKELTRAIKADVLPFTVKTTGKDASARVIAPEVMNRYMELRDAVMEGQVDKPDWWDAVVKA